MTIDEFLDKLAKTAHTKKWSIRRCNMLRCGDNLEQCPITSIEEKGSSYVIDCALRLDLSLEDIEQIVCAADWPDSTPLRQKLLIATGLQDAEPR
jgi:hypothetical protein